jgi:O-antigen/teichoic acid export membrane protein
MTRYLSPAEYGFMATFQVFISVTDAFVGMNLHANITRNFFTMTKPKLAKHISNILVILGTNFFAIMSMVLIFICFFDSFFSIPRKWLVAAPLFAILSMINTINLTIFRNEERPVPYSFFEIFRTVINVSLSLTFVVICKWGWEGPMLGRLLSLFALSIFSVFFLMTRKYISFNVDKKEIKNILSISIPFIPHMLGGLIIISSDRLFLDYYYGKKEVGLYSVGYTWGMLASFLIDAAIKVWSPFFYKKLATPSDEDKKHIVKLTYGFGSLIVLATLVITLLAHFFLPIMVGKSFYASSNYITWVSMGYAVQGFYKISFVYLVLTGKTKFLGFSTVVAAIINLIGNYTLIKINGPIGAAQSTFISFVVSFILVFVYANKIYPMPWNVFKHSRVSK